MPYHNSADKILQAATIMFAEHGYHGTSIRDIANKLNLNVATIYYHFSNKDNLYREVFRHEYLLEVDLVEHIVEEATEVVLRDPVLFSNFILNFTRTYLKLHIQSPILMRLWYYRWLEFPDQADEIDTEYALPLYKTIVSLVEQAREYGAIQPDPVDIRMWLLGLIWLVSGYLFGRKPQFLTKLSSLEDDLPPAIEEYLGQYTIRMLNLIPVPPK